VNKRCAHQAARRRFQASCGELLAHGGTGIQRMLATQSYSSFSVNGLGLGRQITENGTQEVRAAAGDWARGVGLDADIVVLAILRFE
jgi:hypothetical protein